MPRTKRKISYTNTYHVVVKGADRQLLFEEKKDYAKYLEILEYYKQKCHFEIFAYCLMNNHIHLLIRHPDTCPLSTIFRRLNTTYAIWYNRKYDRTGFVQNGRFYSEPIETIQSLINVIHYIHSNPVKAGLEKSPGKSYPWSSARDYTGSKKSITDTHFILDVVGSYDNFKKMYSEASDTNEQFIDIEKFRKRLPDDVAKDIILEVTSCHTSTDFQKLTIVQRNDAIKKICQKGVSIRQLNRLTGTPKGIIERLIK